MNIVVANKNLRVVAWGQSINRTWTVQSLIRSAVGEPKWVTIADGDTEFQALEQFKVYGGVL